MPVDFYVALQTNFLVVDAIVKSPHVRLIAMNAVNMNLVTVVIIAVRSYPMSRYVPLSIANKYAIRWLEKKNWKSKINPRFPFTSPLWSNEKYQEKSLQDAVELQMIQEINQ